MKFLTITLLVASGLFCSCSDNNESENVQAGSDTVITGLEGTRDQQGQISGTKMDTTSGQQPAGASADTTSGTSDGAFIKEQIVGNYNEIGLAKLALKKTADKGIKSIAQQLVTDHTSALEKLKSMASKEKLDVATSPSDEGQSLLTTLETKKTTEFDKAWTEALLDKHKTSITKFDAAAKTVSNTELKTFVDQTLPKLRMHLDKLMAYHGQIK